MSLLEQRRTAAIELLIELNHRTEEYLRQLQVSTDESVELLIEACEMCAKSLEDPKNDDELEVSGR
jgi:hypothetical protein